MKRLYEICEIEEVDSWLVSEKKKSVQILPDELLRHIVSFIPLKEIETYMALLGVSKRGFFYVVKPIRCFMANFLVYFEDFYLCHCTPCKDDAVQCLFEPIRLFFTSEYILRLASGITLTPIVNLYNYVIHCLYGEEWQKPVSYSVFLSIIKLSLLYRVYFAGSPGRGRSYDIVHGVKPESLLRNLYYYDKMRKRAYLLMEMNNLCVMEDLSDNDKVVESAKRLLARHAGNTTEKALYELALNTRGLTTEERKVFAFRVFAVYQPLSIRKADMKDTASIATYRGELLLAPENAFFISACFSYGGIASKASFAYQIHDNLFASKHSSLKQVLSTPMTVLKNQRPLDQYMNAVNLAMPVYLAHCSTWHRLFHQLCGNKFIK